MNKQENNTQHTIYVNQEELEQIRNFSKKVNQEPTFAKGFADRLKEKFKINVAFISLATALAVVSIPAINSNLSNNGIDLVQTAYAEQIVQNPVLEETESKSNDIIKIGDAVYSTAFDAVKGINHLNANEWFNDTPIDVYNTEQREFMNLNVQELNNMELLSTLAQDSNNVMLFGKSLNEPSGFVPLNEVIDKLIQNNEIDFTQLNNNEYAIQPNAQGGYDLILGGVGLGGTECVNLINELKENGIIPQDAEVTPYIDGGHNVPRVNENAQRFTDERLETNYEMAHDPNAEIDFTQLNNNEYAIQPNAQGGYDLILGGVGLGGTECVNLINELKENGIIPQDAEVTPYIDGGHNVPRINENAQRFTDERLETNYEMAHDPNAEIGLSQSEDEHHKTR